MIGEGQESSMDSPTKEKQQSEEIEQQIESYQNHQTSGKPIRIVEGAGKNFVDWLEAEISIQTNNDL